MPDKYEWDQLYKLMFKANEYEDFIRAVATWDGTTDSWYDLFKRYQKGAQTILRKP